MMNLPEETELTPKLIRVYALALFAVISGALWIGFSVDTYFASDGAYYFAIILDNGRFTNIAPARVHAEYLSQWPLVLGVRSGVTDLKMLELLFGLGLWFPWLLGFVVSLYATRERPALIFFFLISLACLNLSTWSLLVGEHQVLLALAWPILFFAILRRPLTMMEAVLTFLLLVAHLRLYESTVATGALFAVIFAFRAWVGKGLRLQLSNGVMAGLALAAVLIALTWILFPRDADNRSSFLGAMVASLGHPYPWMGISFVLLTAYGRIFSSPVALKAGWLVPLTIGVLSIATPGIMGGIAFSTRTLSLTALPLLMVVAVFFSLSRMRTTRSLVMIAAAVIAGISVLHIRHLQSWISFRSRFKEVIKEERGFINPDDHEDLVHWGWTNPLLSYVWSDGEVKAIVLNPGATGWEPFDPKTEVVMERYLAGWPEMVKPK